MEQLSFGTFLRSLRKAQDPPMTQEMLARAVGRNKMTISQFELGKNAPPQGELLNKIVAALVLNPEEEHRLRYLAALSRNSVPSDIADYFFNNPSICEVIRTAKDSGFSEDDWKRIISSLLESKQ